MKLFSRFISWLKGGSPTEPSSPFETLRTQRDAQVIFSEVTVSPTTPPNDQVGDGQFHVVVHNRRPYWALFRCPSGCGEVISLSLQPAHNPRWSVKTDGKGRPTLYPSVWRNNGCRSHFWVEAGRVLWCRDSGAAPSEARPDIYRPRN